jgi:two-component system nitrate/nitrite response regulator NarL
MIVSGAKCPVIQPAKQSHHPKIAMDGSRRLGGEPKVISTTMETRPVVNGAIRSDLEMSNGAPQRVPLMRSLRKLSEREVQILNGIVKGNANKVIARTCDIAEGTVKVHVKAILRKIRVANRTQAAMWALKNGYTAPEFKALPS